MFNFFNKSQKTTIYAPISGKLIPLVQVDDQVFSSKTMGDGFGVQPVAEEVYAPVKGEVTSVFPTKHAFGIKTTEGFEVLVHLGIDTVELEGKPFEVFVKQGDLVTPETKLAKMNLSEIKDAGKSTDVIVAFTNAENPQIILQNLNNQVIANQEIGEIESKLK